MTERRLMEIQELIEETQRRTQMTLRIVAQARELIERNRGGGDGPSRNSKVRLHAECCEDAILLTKIADSSHIERLYRVFGDHGIAATLHFDRYKGLQIRLKGVDRRAFDRFAAEVPVELI